MPERTIALQPCLHEFMPTCCPLQFKCFLCLQKVLSSQNRTSSSLYQILLLANEISWVAKQQICSIHDRSLGPWQNVQPRPAWLTSASFQPYIKLPFDDNGLFNVTTDDTLVAVDDRCKKGKNLGLQQGSSCPKSRYWKSASSYYPRCQSPHCTKPWRQWQPLHEPSYSSKPKMTSTKYPSQQQKQQI